MAENKKWSQKELVNSWTSAARICILDGAPLDNKTLLIRDLLSGTGGGSTLELIKSGDTTLALDTNAFSALRVSNEFLNKKIDDVASGKYTVQKGVQTGVNFAPGVSGSGAFIDANGNGEFESLKLRSFLEAPEYRYNRVKITVGDDWRAPGGGVIESVDTVNKIITLKLEDKEFGEVAVGDKCMGVFHSVNSNDNESFSSDDSKGNKTFSGFVTVYFKVVEIIDTVRNSQFRYELRPISENWGKQIDPYPMMNFVVYANPIDTSRQTSKYSTRSYERYLKGMTDWEISVNNIAAQFGDLSNLTIHGLEMSGYSAYLNNIYMTGTIQQISEIDPITLKYSSVEVPGNPTDNPDNWTDVSDVNTIWMAIQTIKDGIPTAWSIVRTKGEPGDGGSVAGQSTFKSTAFIRTNTAPATPTGGSYESPIPTTVGWSDGVPEGTSKLWSSTRIFTSDGATPQQASWSLPVSLTDNSSVEVMFSSIASSPGNPTANPSNWTITGDVNSIWMATRTIKNGVASSWSIAKVKGESGADALTVVISPENVIVACDASGNPKSGELGSGGKTYFTVDVYRGSTKLTFGSGWQFFNTQYTNMTVGQVSGTSTLYVQTLSNDSAYADFTARIDGNIYITKRVNVRKAYDGSNGEPGTPGTPGTDGITLQLTNTNHAIACDSFGTPLPGEVGSTGRAITTVNVYRGTTKLTFGTDWTFDGGQTSSTSGLSYSQLSGQPTIYVNSMAGDSGHVTIAVKVGTMVFLPKWIITKQKEGRSNLINRRSLWETGKQYYKGLPSEPYFDIVKNGSSWYMCKESHVSGTFSTDLSAGKWQIMNNFENVATDLLLSRQILADEIDTENLVSRSIRTANSGSRVEVFGSEQNFYNENGVRQMQIGIVNGNIVLSYFAADGSKLYDLGPGGFNWGSVKPASWSTYKLAELNQTSTPTISSLSSSIPNWGYQLGEISGTNYYTYYAGVNPSITEADREKEKYLYASQSLTGGYIPDGWYLNPSIPRYADGSVSSSWNSDPTVLKTMTLHSLTAIRYRDLTKYVGGLITSSMKAAWNDGEAMNV